MYILTINSGSTSIKFKLYKMPSESVIASGKIENIGFEKSIVNYHTPMVSEKSGDISIKNHKAGLDYIIKKLTSGKTGVIKDKKDIKAVGHRIVNVGDRVSSHKIIDERFLDVLRECMELAPLHNPPNLMGVEVCFEAFGKNTLNIGIFDNIFHLNIPSKAFLYGINYNYYEKYRIRKYGFHGIAYTYMVKKCAELIGKDLNELKIIALMLGGGSSAAAVLNGISIDTSMGFTPAEGLIMSTRCGDIDPAALSYILNREGFTPKDLDDFINKKSGVLGLSGKYSDFVNIENGYLKNDPDCVRAFDCYCYRIKKYIGSYAAVMNGVDAIIFGGGVGENSPVIRETVLSDMDYLGISLDKNLNNDRSIKEKIVSSKDSKVTVCIAKVDEELIMARETYRLIRN
ncbi:MAG: acetate kinase [Actinomycetota bacterium]|nr:acetate kinase [Actinomycetota bacterium]